MLAGSPVTLFHVFEMAQQIEGARIEPCLGGSVASENNFPVAQNFFGIKLCGAIEVTLSGVELFGHGECATAMQVRARMVGPQFDGLGKGMG